MPDLTALNTFAAYWVLATWVVGALVISLGFGMALIALGHTAIDHWGESLAHYQTALWVHSAMRAHERAGHPRPNKSRTIDEKTKLQRMASALTAARWLRHHHRNHADASSGNGPLLHADARA